MGLNSVPAGKIAAIITSLEMLAPPRPRPLPTSPLRIVRWNTPTPEKYRALFRRVGEPWLWFSRLVLSDEQLAEIIHDEKVEIYAIADPQGIEVGILELDFRTSGQCEIGFFGLVPELSGQGHGGWLMAQTLALGWRKDVSRMWVHTCTLDHPSALSFYRKQGFVPFSREIEVFTDPRLSGHLPRDAAPHIPIIEA